MTTITGIPSSPIPLPTPAPSHAANNPQNNTPASPTITLPDLDGPQPFNLNLQSVQSKRLQAVQQAASASANIYVVSDQKFTIFKDATGQYITRFTSLKDGKVTYIPEPQLLKSLAGAFDPSILKINA